MRKLAALALASAACGTEAAPMKFPAGLEPLEQGNLAAEPAGETITFADGEVQDHIWVHARANINAPLAQVWKALQTAEVIVDRRKVASWTSESGVVPGVRTSHRLHYVVKNVVTVEFDLTWRMDVVAGTPEAPEAVAARFEKTAGTWYISMLAGSIVARAVSENVTTLEFVEHLDAMQEEPEDLKSYLRDLHASIAARAKGKPLPTY